MAAAASSIYALSAAAASVTLESAPPVVVRTVPVAGATDVDPTLTEIRVTFSKPMQDGSWSWSTWGEENFPETTGKIHYLSDGRTCVLPVRLQSGKFYATWLNSEKFKNFKDEDGHPSVPYLLTFTTADRTPGGRVESSKGYEYVIRSGDTLSLIVVAYRERGVEVTLEDVLKANPWLNPTALKVGEKIFIPAKTPSRTAREETVVERKFVRVVLDDKQMTFEGQPATWEGLEKLLSEVSDRDRTVLEWAVPSTQITIKQQNNWSFRFMELAQKYGFEYSSYVGVHPFKSRGGAPPGARPTDGNIP